MACVQGNLEESCQGVMYHSKYSNSNYVQFVSYDILDKLIWKLCEGRIITNKISKQGVPKTNINKIYST